MYDRIQTRPKMVIRNLREMRHADFYGIEFEVENIGSHSSSIEPEINFVGYEPTRAGNKALNQYIIKSTDRKLEPHSPRKFVAGSADIEIFDKLYRTFQFKFSKGWNVKVRKRSFYQTRTINFWRYWFELIKMKIFNVVPEDLLREKKIMEEDPF